MQAQASVIQDLTDQSSVPWGMKGAPGNTINLRSSVPGSVECSPMGHPSPGIDCFTDVFCVDPGTMSEGQSQSPRPLMDLHSGLSRDMGQMFVSQQPISAPITPLQEAEARTGVHGRPALSLMIPDEEISQTNSLIASKSSASQQASGAREGNTPHDLSAASSVTPEKKCRQCSATKTPMWRNDIDGNKTLCNACGVRLQRQVNKAKQVAQQAGEPPPSLIAGKMPRSRTSPAKLAKQEVGSNDAPRTQEGQHSRRPSTASVLDDKSSRSDSLSKRKSSDIHHGKSHSFERKRSCNDLTLSASSPVDTYRNPTCDCDLVVIGIANGLEAAQRIGNCTASVDLHASVPPGSPPGQLQIHLNTGRIAASCGFPRLDCEVRFDPHIQAWRWDGTAQWKLLFLTKEAYNAFEALLRNWKNFAQNRSQATSPAQGTFPLSHRSSLSFGNLAEVGSLYKMSGTDSKFLNHINSKIRQEAGSHPPTTDPKGLCTPVTEEVFERLLSMFELLRTRTSAPQVLTEQAIAALCQKCPWTPNRAVGIAIFRYWLKKAYLKGLRSSPVQSQPVYNDASPVLIDTGLFGRSGSNLLPGMSDNSAMTLHDGPRMQGRGSEDSSAGSYPFCSPLDSASMAHQMPFPPTSAFLSEGSFAMHTEALLGGSNMYARPAWENTFMPSHAGFEQGQQEWDPLDPEYLAKIADPCGSPSISPIPNLEDKKSSNVQGGPVIPSMKSEDGLGYGHDLAMNTENFKPHGLDPNRLPVKMEDASNLYLPTEQTFPSLQFRKDLFSDIDNMNDQMVMGMPSPPLENQGGSFASEPHS